MINDRYRATVEKHHEPSDIVTLPPAINEMFKLYSQFGPITNNNSKYLEKRSANQTNNEYFDSDLRIHDMLDHLFLGVGLTIRGDSVSINDLDDNHSEDFNKEVNYMQSAIDTWVIENKEFIQTIGDVSNTDIADRFLEFVISKYGNSTYSDNLKTFIGRNFIRDWIHIIPKEDFGQLLRDQTDLSIEFKSIKKEQKDLKTDFDKVSKNDSGYAEQLEQATSKNEELMAIDKYLNGLSQSRLVDHFKRFEEEINQEKFFHFQLYNIKLDWFNRIAPQLETMESFPVPDKKCLDAITALNEQFQAHPEQFNIPTDQNHILGIQGIYQKRAKKANDALKAIVTKYIDTPGRNEMIKAQYLVLNKDEE